MKNIVIKNCKNSPDGQHHLLRGCICSVSALEPEDNCPIHGHNYLNQCHYCGQFVERVRGFDPIKYNDLVQ